MKCVIPSATHPQWGKWWRWSYAKQPHDAHRRRWVLPTVRYWEQYPQQQQHFAAFCILHVPSLTLCIALFCKANSLTTSRDCKAWRGGRVRYEKELRSSILLLPGGKKVQLSSIMSNSVVHGRGGKTARSINSSMQCQHSAGDIRATCDDAIRFEHQHTRKECTLHIVALFLAID